jgi:thiol-disulfide isomerase/thioredoxin
MMPRFSLTAAAMAVALGLSACSTTGSEEGTGGGSTEVPESGTGQGRDGAAGETSEALAFVARTVDGEEFTGASLEGEPAVLWFWAPWCTVCRGEASGVVDAAERHAGDVEFLGVAGLGEVDDMRAFVSETGTGDLTHIVDEDGTIWSGFGVVSQPAFAFVHSDGTVETVSGTLTDSDLDAYVDSVVSGS